MLPGSELIEPSRSLRRRWGFAVLVALGLHAGGGAFGMLQWREEEAVDDPAGPIMVELAPIAVASLLDLPDLAHGPLAEEAALTPQAAKQKIEEVDKEIPPLEQSLVAPDPEVTLPVPKPVNDKKPDAQENQEAVRVDPNLAETAPAPLTTAPPRIDAKPAEVAAAPAPGTSTTPSRAQATWEKSLVSHLNRFKRYPGNARAHHIQGVVSVEFTLDREGRVIASRIVKSSGSSVLDEEAIAVLQRASPLPAPPAEVAGATFDLALPIHFRIR